MERMAGGSTTRSAENVSVAASRVSEPELLPIPLYQTDRTKKEAGKGLKTEDFFGSARLKIHRQWDLSSASLRGKMIGKSVDFRHFSRYENGVRLPFICAAAVLLIFLCSYSLLSMRE